MAHDFERFPELTNSQMELYYFDSPHKQISEDFEAEVVKVHDGDTITVRASFRDFDFPIRFIGTNAPELNEPGGKESKDWLEERIQGKKVQIIVNSKQRVGKFGRLLGDVIHGGMSMNEISIIEGKATDFDNRDEGQIPNINKILR